MSEKEKYELISGEKKEKEPKISYEILYSAHGTAEDFEGLAEVFPIWRRRNF